VGKLRHRYASCRHPVEKPRWHALWLLARTDAPRTPAAVADVVGLSAVTVPTSSTGGTTAAPTGWPTGSGGTGPSPG
jgi:hypothetical protein